EIQQSPNAASLKYKLRVRIISKAVELRIQFDSDSRLIHRRVLHFQKLANVLMEIPVKTNDLLRSFQRDTRPISFDVIGIERHHFFVTLVVEMIDVAVEILFGHLRTPFAKRFAVEARLAKKGARQRSNSPRLGIVAAWI